MRSVWRSGAPVLLAAALLAGCSLQGAGGATSAPPDSGVAEHWSVLEGEARLPAVGTRWTSGPMEELTPSPDYGELVPYAGAGYYLVYPDGEGGTVQSPSLSTLYGLMTVDGCAVLDPVCDSISRLSWIDGDGQDQWLPVWKLARSGPDGDLMDGALSALAALDGSWSTPFQYWGAAGSPVGIFAGDGEDLYLLDSGSGAEKTRWSWEELGITEPENFPWFTGDAYSTAQWQDGLFYLGSWGEDYDARLLDPETGEVTVITDRAWAERLDAAFQHRDMDWWEVTTGEDDSVTVSKGAEVYTFPSPLPGESYPYEMDGRVLFQDYGSGSFAVTTREGELVLPAQKGELSTLEPEGGKYLAVQKTPDGDWQLYDWDGNPGVLLPGGTESWCRTAGPLVEVYSRENAAYYRPDTGECVFRAWFGLEERPGL